MADEMKKRHIPACLSQKGLVVPAGLRLNLKHQLYIELHCGHCEPAYPTFHCTTCLNENEVTMGVPFEALLPYGIILAV